MDTYNPYSEKAALEDTIRYLQFKPRYFAPDVVKRQAKLIKNILGYKISWRKVIKYATRLGYQEKTHLLRELDRMYTVGRRAKGWDNPYGYGVYSPDYNTALKLINPDDVLIVRAEIGEASGMLIINIVFKNGTRYCHAAEWVPAGNIGYSHQDIYPDILVDFLWSLDESTTRIYTKLPFFDHTEKGSIA